MAQQKEFTASDKVILNDQLMRRLAEMGYKLDVSELKMRAVGSDVDVFGLMGYLNIHGEEIPFMRREGEIVLVGKGK